MCACACMQEVAQLQRELARTSADAAAIYRGAMSREMLARERALRGELQVGAGWYNRPVHR